ncbi:MAG TPA: amylo-alpha-1,6-glucosidase [Candidatus Acidoferrum sp.]|nr:amylo-alpha-1,6-glucosidase [Candidatus Acidoferrum sp.]
MPERAEIQFGREICGDLAAAESREWLVTNGIGGYASGTVAGSLTRRYHGLLIAALQPPVGRTQLVATIDEIVHYAGTDFSLAIHRWAGGAVDPKGYLSLEDFHLQGTKPVWTYALADALLEKRVWMRHGENTTFIQYTLLRASSAIEMELKALVNYRDFHSSTHAADWRMKIQVVEHGVMILAFDAAAPFFLKSTGASCEPRHDWYRGCYFAEETARGLDDREDHLFAALFRAKLEAGSSVTFVATTEPNTVLDGETARAESADHEVKLFQAWQEKNQATSAKAPSWLRQLVLAADQFIVKRSLPEEPDGRSIIAGYHWFGDWGRDTMIALPGLTLATGRTDVAKKILLAFSRYIDAGMLPNNFPDAGGKPEYNTVDAALWYFEAIRQYFAATGDADTLQKLFPVLAGMIDAHLKGTRYNIHADPADGLIHAGAPGVQLTWMDAKIGEWVVTPRIGKPIEINALWINALETVAGFARLLGKSSDACEKLASRAKNSFQKFWNAERNCCYDVIDSPGIGNDASLRPNQIFGVSLPVSPLSAEQQRAVVDVCARHLLTSLGLRSLAPLESGYIGHYGGSPRDRDAAYHQGTVWGWLLGPFALAHHRVYRNRAAALRFLEPLGRQVHASGLGTLSEIFDGDAPFAPGGCIAQAWTVGEVLRTWKEITHDA